MVFLRMHKDLAPVSTKIQRIDTSFPQFCNKKGKNAKRTKKNRPRSLADNGGDCQGQSPGILKISLAQENVSLLVNGQN